MIKLFVGLYLIGFTWAMEIGHAKDSRMLNDTLTNRDKRFGKSPCGSSTCGTYGLCYVINFPQPMPDRFYCVCSPGFSGEFCEQEIDECAASPCKNGICFDLVNAFYCSCPTGYTGQFCEINLNDDRACQPGVCGDGECQLTTHASYKFVCKCRDGSYKFEACPVEMSRKCDAQPCFPNPCIEAPNSPTGYICQCGENEFKSTSCQNTAAVCQGNSCYNGGTCVTHSPHEPWCNPSQAGKTCCQCLTGFTGLKCEIDIDECQSQPCLNGGSCTNLINSYKCACPQGYTGYNCEKKVGCFSNPCKFGSMCNVDQYNNEMCICKAGFEGKYCEIDINECLSSPCQNGGTCIDLENSYACYCPDGYFRPTSCPAITTTTTTKAPSTTTTMATTAARPTTPAFSCNPDPCFNNAVCTPYGCKCQHGFSGQFCEIYTVSNGCNSLQCLNGATCDEHNNQSAYCLCKPGFTGLRCETEYFRCQSNGLFADPYGCSMGKYLECAYYGERIIGFPNGVLYRRDCPTDLRFNQKFGYCDYSDNVLC